MDLCSKKAVKFWLKKYGLQPSKRLGQNFLIDKSVLRKIIEAAFPSTPPPPGGGVENVVLEIGPGIGTLTRELIQRAKNVIAVEKDAKMVEILKETLKDYKNIEIFHDDILKTDPKSYKLQATSYKIISNLPYNVATAIIRKFLEAENPPTEMILMVQKEVAQRITAKPPRMNLLAVSVQFFAEPKIISYISKKSFWPQPKVDSAIIKIKPSPGDGPLKVARINRGRTSVRVPRGRTSGAEDLFFKIVKAGYSQPRKQLINNLAPLAAPALASPGGADGRRETQEEQRKKGEQREKRGQEEREGKKGQRRKREQREQEGRERKEKKEGGKEKIKTWLLKNNIQPTQRAETLTINDWISLAKSF